MTPREITDRMLEKDAFSRWLGIVVDEVSFGESRIHFTITEAMLNGHGTAHGGIAHSASDSAFAFACNSHGVKAVAAETHTSYLRPLYVGDRIDLHCTELHRGRKLGRYEVQLNRAGKAVALFRSTCYFLDEEW